MTEQLANMIQGRIQTGLERCNLLAQEERLRSATISHVLTRQVLRNQEVALQILGDAAEIVAELTGDLLKPLRDPGGKTSGGAACPAICAAW